MNENKPQIFNSEEFGSVRVLTIDGEPYFVGKDVATILGYSDTAKAIRVHVDDEDKQIFKVDEMATLKTSNYGVYVINESGLYSLILSSKLPTAKKFKRWVTAEVLPAIRKHGSYNTHQDSYMIDDPVKRAERWIEEQKEKQKLITTVAVQEQQISELQPKASYYDVVLNCPDLLPISAIAKDYGKSAKWLNAYLHENGIQYKQGDIWLLYQKYAQKGYTSTKTCTLNGRDGLQHAKIHTYWTQKGRLFIYDLLKSAGIYPTIEA